MTADVPMSEPVPEGATGRLKLTLSEHIDSGASGDSCHPACTCIEFGADGYVIEDSTALDCPRHGVTLAEHHRVRDLEAEVARLRGVVARVEALHVRLEGVTVAGWCRGDGRKWPCPTARALAESQPDGGA